LKRILLFIIFIVLNLNSFSQYIFYRNKLDLSGSLFIYEVFRFNEIEDAGWADNGKGYGFGFNYCRRIRYNIWVHSGIHYLYGSNDYYSSPGSSSVPQISLKQNAHIFQFPLRLGYHFLFNDLLYLRSGLTIDYQLNKKEGIYIDDQSGIGFSLEGGLEMELEHNFHINLGPEIQVLSLIPFNQEKHQQHFAILRFNIIFGYDL